MKLIEIVNIDPKDADGVPLILDARNDCNEIDPWRYRPPGRGGQALLEDLNEFGALDLSKRVPKK